MNLLCGGKRIHVLFSEFTIDVIGTLQNLFFFPFFTQSPTMSVNFHADVTDTSNTEGDRRWRWRGVSFRARSNLLIPIDGRHVRAAFNFVAVRRAKSGRKKYPIRWTHRKTVIVRATCFRRYSPVSGVLTRSFWFTAELWQPVGSLIFHRSSPSYSADFSAGRNKRATNFCGAVQWPLRFNERDLIAPSSSLTPPSSHSRAPIIPGWPRLGAINSAETYGSIVLSTQHSNCYREP